jgi:hypothetical protein
MANGTKTLQFKTVQGEPVTGTVVNPDATIGSLAPRIAQRLGIAGTFEVLDANSRVLNPQTRLADLPDGAELTLASELTPAAR